MNLELKEKTVLVTGGSKGIGFACAKAMAAEGARVAIVSRHQANLDSALRELNGAIGIAADLTDALAAARAVDEVERRLGAVDVLINSAGAAQRMPAPELSPPAWRAAMDAKFFSYIHVIDPLIKRMAGRGAGVIVNVIGNGGKMAAVTHIAGGCANAALMLATAGLGAAYAAKGVRVVGINPGLTHTGRVEEGVRAQARQLSLSEADTLARMVAAVPMGRMAEPEEIASVVAFLASARASYVTGVTLSMDGAAAPIVM
jgi:NAD(P)-dependent dehydrogenase (short-subunit alcohol dehydrogenase family)